MASHNHTEYSKVDILVVTTVTRSRPYFSANFQEKLRYVVENIPQVRIYMSLSEWAVWLVENFANFPGFL